VALVVAFRLLSARASLSRKARACL
jgi:hypothetical protein